jgi:hypothetical protein
MPEQDVLEVARAGLQSELDFLARNYGETADSLAAAEMVQFVEWQPRIGSLYAVTYDTGSGVFYTVNVSPGCGIELSFSRYLGRREGRLIYEKR